MSCCEGNSGLERYPGTGCCGTSCVAGETGCLASEVRIRSCFCQENVGCLDRPDCGGFRPRGTAATGACPGPCQCAEEEAWNRNVPPKPNCEWLSNFSELRRQWSDHGRQNNCKCCNCKPCRTAAPCSPCLTPPPTCSTVNFSRENHQKYCSNKRLSGGACDEKIINRRNSPSRHRDRSPGGGCPPNNYSCKITSICPPTPNSNMYSCSSPPCSSPSECSIPNAWPQCRPPSSCQPCSPSSRLIIKNRSCCQCTSGCCMCQPMPRTCNCPPPVQVDARASHECSCDCPSSPECACPPSERRFSRSKVKCPNARLCCPTPRAKPGPKCCCTKCQPCLPPPCDPCTANKCQTVLPKIKPCYGDSSCDESAPCRTSTTQPQSCQGTSPCADCGKIPTSCHPPIQRCSPGATSVSRPGSARQIRHLNRPKSPDAQRCSLSSTKYCSPGQSCCRFDVRDNNNNDAKEKLLSAANEGFGDNDGEADPGCRESQCHCGQTDSRGWHEESDFSCFLHREKIHEANDDYQCNCGNANGCADECDYCCSLGCNRADTTPENNVVETDDQAQCACGPQENSCDEFCDYCCSQNCDFESNIKDNIGESTVYAKSERIAAGGSNLSHDTKDYNKLCKQENESVNEPRVVFPTDADNISQTAVESEKSAKFGSRSFNSSLAATPEDPELEALSQIVSGCIIKIEPADESKGVCDGVVPTVDRGQRVTSTASRLTTSRCTIYVCGFDGESGKRTIFSYLGSIGHSILVPGPLTLVSFVLIISLGLIWAFGLALYHRYNCPKATMKILHTDVKYYRHYVVGAQKHLGPRDPERCDQQPRSCSLSGSHHQCRANCYQSSMFYSTLPHHLPFAHRFSILELLEQSWQIGRFSKCSCFEDSVLFDEDTRSCHKLVDASVGDSIEISKTTDAAVNSQSQFDVTERKFSKTQGNSCMCNMTSITHISIVGQSSNVSSVSHSREDLKKSATKLGPKIETSGIEIVCDDGRNIISNIDFCAN